MHVDPDVFPTVVHVSVGCPDFAALTVTVPPDSLAVTEIVGVVSVVLLSLALEPVSDPATKSGVEGADGAVTSGPYLIMKCSVDWTVLKVATAFVPIAATRGVSRPPAGLRLPTQTFDARRTHIKPPLDE